MRSILYWYLQKEFNITVSGGLFTCKSNIVCQPMKQEALSDFSIDWEDSWSLQLRKNSNTLLSSNNLGSETDDGDKPDAGLLQFTSHICSKYKIIQKQQKTNVSPKLV